MTEQSLILIKHDGVARGLIGRIVQRLEDIGLKIAAMKMVWADDKIAKQHYKLDEEWAKNVHDKTKAVYDKIGKKWPYKDHMHIGETIQSWNRKFLQEGPIVAMIIEGPDAIAIVREIVGNTEPRQAAPGTIRGDFAKLESYKIGDEKKRVLRNLIHASDSENNAKHEIALWFKPEEIHSYKKELDKHF